MPFIQRRLAADAMTFRLGEEHLNMRGSVRRGSGPASRTLIKHGPLSVTLVALPAGGRIREHQANGPLTVHLLSGALTFHTPDDAHNLVAGDLLCLASEIRHSVETEAGANFLLTIASVG